MITAVVLNTADRGSIPTVGEPLAADPGLSEGYPGTGAGGPLRGRRGGGGCRGTPFGVQSADPAVLDALKKGITLEKVREAFRSTRAAGVATVANLMVGSPGETWG